MKQKKPVKLNAVIYNNLVKLFNDSANQAETYEERKMIVDARKRFPTYHELLEMDLMYVSTPRFIDIDGNDRYCKTWISNPNEPCDGEFDASFENVEYVYAIGLCRVENGVVFKLRGTHKGDIK